MAVTATTLKARFVEFAPVADDVVAAAIAEASRRTDARVFGNRTDDAITLRACDLLATGAFGLASRQDAKGNTGPTTYAQQLATIVRERAGGAWVVGLTNLGGPV